MHCIGIILKENCIQLVSLQWLQNCLTCNYNWSDDQQMISRWPADDQQMTSRWPAVSLLRLSYQLSTLRLIKQLRTIILIRWLEFRHYLTIASQTLKMKIVLTKKCSCHFGSSHIICFPKSMWLSGWGGIFLWYISCLYSVA